MFVRWQKRTKSAGWKKRTLKELPLEDVHWQAIIVRSIREGGKVKQEHVATLGGFTECDVVANKKRIDRFWIIARQRLDRLSNRISADERDIIELSIRKKMSEITQRLGGPAEAERLAAYKQRMRDRFTEKRPVFDEERKAISKGLKGHRKSLRDAERQMESEFLNARLKDDLC